MPIILDTLRWFCFLLVHCVFLVHSTLFILNKIQNQYPNQIHWCRLDVVPGCCTPATHWCSQEDGSKLQSEFHYTFMEPTDNFVVWSVTPGWDSWLPVRCPNTDRGTQPRLRGAERLGHREEEEAASGTSLWHGERTTFLSCTQSSHLPVRFRGQLTCCHSWCHCQKFPEFTFGIC